MTYFEHVDTFSGGMIHPYTDREFDTRYLDAFNDILSRIMNGATMYVMSELHTHKIDRKGIQRWRAAGFELIEYRRTRDGKGRLMMGQGRGHVDISRNVLRFI